MAGQIKKMIDHIVKERSQGNSSIATTTRTKLILKGISPQKYNDLSEDDPTVIGKLESIASEFGIANL